MWVIPMAVAVAMVEDEMAGAAFGALAGLLCDLGTQTLFGFNGLLMLMGCAAIGLLCIFLVKVNYRSAFLLGAALGAVRALLEFFFFYVIWDYGDTQLIFIHSVLPTFVYTALLTPLFLLLTRYIKAQCHSRWEE